MAGEPLEDARGVDLADLRRRLALSPAERIDRMVDEVRALTEILDAARTPVDRS